MKTIIISISNILLHVLPAIIIFYIFYYMIFGHKSFFRGSKTELDTELLIDKALSVGVTILIYSIYYGIKNITESYHIIFKL